MLLEHAPRVSWRTRCAHNFPLYFLGSVRYKVGVGPSTDLEKENTMEVNAPFSEKTVKALTDAGLAGVIARLHTIEVKSGVENLKGVARLGLSFRKTDMWTARAAAFRLAAGVDILLLSAPEDLWPQDPYFTTEVRVEEASQNAWAEVVLTGEVMDHGTLETLLKDLLYL